MRVNVEALEEFCDLLYKNHNQIYMECLRSHIQTCQLIKSNTKWAGVDPKNDPELRQLIIKICSRMIICLRVGFGNVDTQFLCATCLYNFIGVLPQDERMNILQKINSIIYEYYKMKEEQEWIIESDSIIQPPEDSISDLTAMSLINGFFYSNLMFIENSEKSILISLCNDFLHISISTVIKLCMKYSSCTYMSFRNLNVILMKIVQWDFISDMRPNMINAVSFVIIYNWENPLSGIKEHNANILANYLCILQDYLDEFIENIQHFPWNKAKYYILCEIITHVKIKRGNDYSYLYPHLMQGLTYSLKHHHFVSAGSDLYKVILQTLEPFSQWYEMFFQLFKKTLLRGEHTEKVNLLNHWFPVTLKKYNSLLSIFLNIFLEQPNSEKTDYYFLFIIKLGRKYGHILIEWEDNASNIGSIKKFIKKSLSHLNDDIRSQAFEIICESSKYTSLPSNEEFHMVKDFLISNVNYDSSTFRQSCLNSFTNFLIRVRDSYLHRINDFHKVNATVEVYKFFLEDFFTWLHLFIMENFQDYGNYQRKIMSLEMFSIILKYLYAGYVGRDSNFGLCKKSNQRYEGWKLVEYLKNENKWDFENNRCIEILLQLSKSQTSDIREISINILGRFYLDDTALFKYKNKLLIDALILCNSKKFYEIESGSMLFKLISKLNNIFVEKDNFLFDGGESYKNILNYLMQKAQQQFNFHQEDILFSINNNQPLYGLLLATSVFIKNANQKIEYTLLIEIINLICDIAYYFLDILCIKASSKEHAPDFLEMDESIKHIITTSKCSQDISANDAQMSDDYQLVLNHIWLNLKACCELASTLVTTCFDTLDHEDIKKCIEITVAVLTKCRHKGAIESAGVCLGTCVKHLTLLKNDGYRKYISDILEKSLKDATSNDGEGRSVTRRSAGLTILIHRIITNDTLDGKPFFHNAIRMLINVLKQIEDYQQKLKYLCKAFIDSKQNNEHSKKEKDMPIATGIHLLCRTIIDSSLSYYVLQYASQLLGICFRYFRSKEWQVRNAALQLFGALIPKLIGQKSKMEENIIMESCISADELFSHIPGTWELIMNILGKCCNIKNPKDKFYAHSNLIPVLSLLSNLARRFGFQQPDATFSKQILYLIDIEEGFHFFISLLSSPIYTVRNMTAKIIVSFFNVDMFYDYFLHSKPPLTKENQLHGFLLVIKYFTKFYSYLENFMEEDYIYNIMVKLEDITSRIGKHMATERSFITKALFVEIINDLTNKNLSIDQMKVLTKTFEIFNQYKETIDTQCGIYHWLNVSIFNCVKMCNENDLCNMVEYCMKCLDASSDGFLPAFMYRIKHNIPKNDLILRKLAITFKNFCYKEHEYVNKDIFEITYILINRSSVDALVLYDKDNLKNFILLCDDKDLSYSSSYLLPLISLILTKRFILIPQTDVMELIVDIAKVIKKLSNCNMYNTDIRMMCAKSIQHLADVTIHLYRNPCQNDKLIVSVKYDVLLTAIWLLQDEDVDVRYESAKALFLNEIFVTHPTNKLRGILTFNFLKNYFNNMNHCVVGLLRTINKEIIDIKNQNISQVDLQNPFDHNTKNVYWELDLIQKSVLRILSNVKEGLSQ